MSDVSDELIVSDVSDELIVSAVENRECESCLMTHKCNTILTPTASATARSTSPPRTSSASSSATSAAWSSPSPSPPTTPPSPTPVRPLTLLNPRSQQRRALPRLQGSRHVQAGSLSPPLSRADRPRAIAALLASSLPLQHRARGGRLRRQPVHSSQEGGAMVGEGAFRHV